MFYIFGVVAIFLIASATGMGIVFAARRRLGLKVSPAIFAIVPTIAAVVVIVNLK